MERSLLIPGLEHIRAEPCWDHLRDVLLRRNIPDRVPFMELFLDDEIIAAVLERPVDSFADAAEAYLRLGYHNVPYRITPAFARPGHSTADTASLSRGDRDWVMGGGGLISSRDDFESYPWPGPDPRVASGLESAAGVAPEGMGITLRTSGVLDNVLRIMSYEGASEVLYDDPGLFQEVTDRVGECIYRAHEQCIGCERVVGTFFGDDMGFKTSTMISPAHLRQYILPWHKKLSELVHSHGKMFLMHACGQVDAVMEDLITDVGIDAKHSFEDAIEPVSSIKRRYGDRIGIIGGVDMNILAQAAPDEVRAYALRVLEQCAPGGGYALGSGNSIANYVPLENYFAMLQAGWEFRA